MNIRCPQCQTVFRVDPEKVPEGGVRARCARCSAVFALNRSGLVNARPVAAAAAVSSAPAAAAPARHAGCGSRGSAGDPTFATNASSTRRRRNLLRRPGVRAS